MTSNKLGRLIILFVAALCTFAPLVSGQEVGEVPQEVAASRTDSGILVTSKARGNEFSLMLQGRDIRPLSSERLKLSVDGREVEIVTIPLAPDLMNKPGTETLAIYQHWVLSRLEQQGWQLAPSGDESFAFPNGKACFLWQMQRVPNAGQPENRIVVATTNQSNVIALVGSIDDANGLAPLKTFLRTVLLTLRPEKPAETHQPTGYEVLNLGTDLRQGYDVWFALTGHETRFLLNKHLMTEADGSFQAAVPVDQEILMQGLRQAVQNAGGKAFVVTEVFDGKFAHVVDIQSYDPQANAFTYFDPWGTGSFLAAGSNAAGVTATPDLSQKRFWIIKSKQLESVIYAIELEFEDMLKLAASMPLGAFDALGDRINDATQTDLFTWFHLEQAGLSKNATGHDVLTFRSSGAQFRPLASVDLTTDERGRLLAADLRLLRSFINDQTTTVFARDLANSFIRSATSVRDKAWLDPLMNQIEFDLPGYKILAQPPDMALPKHPTDDYLAFLGQKQDVTYQLSLTKLGMTNIGTNNDSALLISLETVR